MDQASSANRSVVERGDDLLTVDELATATGLTVRTARYYAGLGLLPPPERRGRIAYYSAAHRARLELIRALQDHGFTLAAIEKYLARLPADATVEDLAIQRTMFTSWTAGPYEVVDAAGLAKRVGHPVEDDRLRSLIAMSAIRVTDDGRYELLPTFDVGIRALALDVPIDTLLLAAQAIGRHMDELADELTDVLRDGVITPLLERPRVGDDAARFEETLGTLRQLTLEAVVTGFQRAANEIINRSLSER